MKREKGALTVEACLSLSIFMIVFMTIMYFMRVIFAYEIVQHALNQTAKEFSSYSYYYALSGLADINGTIQTSTAPGRERFNLNVSNVVNVYNSFSKLGDDLGDAGSKLMDGDLKGFVGTVPTVSKDYNAARKSIAPAVNTIKSIVDDPMSAIKAVGSVLLNGGNETAKTLLCGELARAMMAKYIDTDYGRANARLKALRIIGGLDGLDFSSSVFWAEGATNDIQFVVYYTIKPIFPLKVIDKINMVNTVRVRGWSGKSLF